jgi:hypothetical protein
MWCDILVPACVERSNFYTDFVALPREKRLSPDIETELSMSGWKESHKGASPRG